MRARIFLGAVLALILGFVPVTFAPGQVAYAAMCYPPSTINPACQPANIPILMDAGIVSTGGKTALATTSPGALVPSGGGGALGVVKFLWNAAQNILGLTSLVQQVSTAAGTATTTGTLGMQGTQGLQVQTDPNYVPPSAFRCNYANGYRTSQSATSSSCSTFPVYQGGTNSQPTAPPLAGQLTVAFSFSPGSQTMGVMTFTPVGVTAPYSFKLVPRCGSSPPYGLYSSVPTYTVNRSTNLSAPFDVPVQCGNGQSPLVLVEVFAGQTGAGNWAQSGTLWNSASPTTSPDGRVQATVRMDVQCKTAAGTILNVSAETPINANAGQLVRLADAVCPAGSVAQDAQGFIRAPDTTTWEPITQPVTVPDVVKELPTQYPSCFPADGGNPCQLELFKQPSGGALESCGNNGELCIGWSRSPNAPSIYRCYYGPYEVSLNKCSAYRAPEIGVLPNTNPDGTEIPWDAPVPSTLPNPVVPQPGTPSPGGSQTSECFPTGWGVLNPVSWVLMPVQCALTWAFVPNPQTMTALGTSLQQTVKASLLGSSERMITSWVSVFDIAASSCQGPPFKIQMEGDLFPGGGINEVYYPLSACDPPMSGIASFFNMLSGVFVLIVAGLAVVRHFASIFGFGGLGAMVSDINEANAPPKPGSSVRFK